MNKKSCTFFLLSSFVLTFLASAEPLAEWDPAAGKVIGGKLSVPDSVSGIPLEGWAETDSNIELSSTFPDGAAIVLGGKQTKPIRTGAGRTLLIGSGTGLEVSFFPEDTTEDMTLLASPGLELRYIGSRQRLDVIVYYATQEQTNSYVALNFEAKPGEWSTAQVSLSDTMVSAEVNGLSLNKKLLNSIKTEPAALQLGMKNDSRPFRGKIGKIKLTQ